MYGKNKMKIKPLEKILFVSGILAVSALLYSTGINAVRKYNLRIEKENSAKIETRMQRLYNEKRKPLTFERIEIEGGSNLPTNLHQENQMEIDLRDEPTNTPDYEEMPYTPTNTPSTPKERKSRDYA